MIAEIKQPIPFPNIDTNKSIQLKSSNSSLNSEINNINESKNHSTGSIKTDESKNKCKILKEGKQDIQLMNKKRKRDSSNFFEKKWKCEIDSEKDDEISVSFKVLSDMTLTSSNPVEDSNKMFFDLKENIKNNKIKKVSDIKFNFDKNIKNNGINDKDELPKICYNKNELRIERQGSQTVIKIRNNKKNTKNQKNQSRSVTKYPLRKYYLRKNIIDPEIKDKKYDNNNNIQNIKKKDEAKNIQKKRNIKSDTIKNQRTKGIKNDIQNFNSCQEKTQKKKVNNINSDIKNRRKTLKFDIDEVNKTKNGKINNYNSNRKNRDKLTKFEMKEDNKEKKENISQNNSYEKIIKIRYSNFDKILNFPEIKYSVFCGYNIMQYTEKYHGLISTINPRNYRLLDKSFKLDEEMSKKFKNYKEYIKKTKKNLKLSKFIEQTEILSKNNAIKYLTLKGKSYVHLVYSLTEFYFYKICSFAGNNRFIIDDNYEAFNLEKDDEIIILNSIYIFNYSNKPIKILSLRKKI